MVKAFIEAPRDWDPVPGRNRAVKETDGTYAEVVRVYPVPAISGTFHLQLMAQWKVEKVEVVNHCPMLYVRQRLCGALSTAQFSVACDYPGAESNPDFVVGFKAYGYDLIVLGRKNTLIDRIDPPPLKLPGRFSLADK